MSKKYKEESAWKTIWEFLPGISKFLSLVVSLVLIVNATTIFGSSSEDIRAKSKAFDVSIQRDYNFAYGKEDAKVKLLYFADFQCPACKANNPIIEQIKPSYNDKIQFVYKHFPLESIHPYAKSTAQAAQAAGKQGKFNEYALQAYATQDNGLTSSNLEGAARVVGLDIDRWNNDRFSTAIAKEVEADQKDLTEAEFPVSSVTGKRKSSGDLKDIGTPISVLYKDGKVVDWWTGGLPAEELKKILDKALE